MEFIEYIEEFRKIIVKRHSNPKTSTIEDYLATFADLPPILERTKKSDIFADLFRCQGNESFANGDHKSAAILYTSSLMHAAPYSKCAALAYANRSAALYQMKAYKECVSDIDRALDLPYPDNLKKKIVLRKDTALCYVREGAEASEKEVESPIESLKLARGEQTMISGLTQGIKVAYNVQQGRNLVAKSPFQPGDVLLIDKPYLAVPKFDVDPAFCHHCLKLTLCLIPCDRCVNRVYCSDECRLDAFDKYHRIECVIIETLASIEPSNGQTAACLVRCISIFTKQGDDLNAFYEDFEDVENDENPAKLGFTGDRYVSDTRKAFLSLPVRELKQERQANLFEAGYVVTLLRNYTDFFKTNVDVHRVAKLLIKLNLIYTSNHFPIRYLGPRKPKAFAMFPLTGLANHACTNNTVAYVDNDNRLVLRASQYIRPGDQIQYNYHNLFFMFDGAGKKKSGQTQQCKRMCGKCDKTYSYPSERQPHIKIDKKLTAKLMKNPYDVDSLWKLLNWMLGKNQRYTYQVQMLKVGLVDAYEKCDDRVKGYLRFNLMGIL